jgi:acetylglutamate kinase
MKLVVKIGGQASDDAKQRRRLARQIAQLAQIGHWVTVVHGGGKLLTATLERLGVATEFHHGLRVTDDATRDVALMVLAGVVNKRWVAEIEAQGQPALGLCGGDAGLVKARKLRPLAGRSPKKLGWVGEPQRVNPRILEIAFEQGLVPVVASLAPNARGEYLNMNADDLASALAVALRADRLCYLTESGGVWDAARQLLPVVKVKDIAGLIERGVVRDGMIPKLLSCARTLGRHVSEIDIISPAVPQGLWRALGEGEPVGTRILNS